MDEVQYDGNKLAVELAANNCTVYRGCHASITNKNNWLISHSRCGRSFRSLFVTVIGRVGRPCNVELYCVAFSSSTAFYLRTQRGFSVLN